MMTAVLRKGAAREMKQKAAAGHTASATIVHLLHKPSAKVIPLEQKKEVLLKGMEMASLSGRLLSLSFLLSECTDDDTADGRVLYTALGAVAMETLREVNEVGIALSALCLKISNVIQEEEKRASAH
jgi:hypothetical protein